MRYGNSRTFRSQSASAPGQPVMRQTEFDEPEFLARLRRGEEQAYRALIRRFHGSLIGVAASIIGSRAQAEEVVQDAWLAVFSGHRRLRGPLQSWSPGCSASC